MKATFVLPLRTKTGLNSREHHFARARRVKKERNAGKFGAMTASVEHANGRLRANQIPGPWLVTLARISPATRMPDDDGVVGGLKGVRDGIADALGVDDGDRTQIRFRYRMERGEWGVRVEIESVEKFEEEAA